MTPKLKKISSKNANKYFLDSSILIDIIKKKEHFFEIERSSCDLGKNNPLLALEISLRRCERLGVFRK